MKKITVDLRQFYGMLAQRKEYLMARPKSIYKIKIETIWQEDDEENEEATFPINADVLVVKQYEGEDRTEMSLSRIQNGKNEVIYEVNGFNEDIEADEIEAFFRIKEEFEIKGFRRIE